MATSSTTASLVDTVKAYRSLESLMVWLNAFFYILLVLWYLLSLFTDFVWSFGYGWFGFWAWCGYLFGNILFMTLAEWINIASLGKQPGFYWVYLVIKILLIAGGYFVGFVFYGDFCDTVDYMGEYLDADEDTKA